MSKVKIKLVILGHIPLDLDKVKLTKWKSEVFEIVGQIDSYTITNNADGASWEFMDNNIGALLPERFEGDFLIAMTHVPLEGNYYVRRLNNNRICMTFHEIASILSSRNIPIENVVYRLLYSYTIIYKQCGNRIPSIDEGAVFTHDETRGCLFDMNGVKSDIIYSTTQPIICNECTQRLTVDRVPENIIHKAKEEIKKIRKVTYYRITDLIKKHLIWALIISTFSALVLGVMGSLIATVLWEILLK